MAPSCRRGVARIALLALVVTALVAAAVSAHAQTNPFGGARPPAGGDFGGVIGWLLAKQSEFYRALSGLIRAAKADGSAVWGLLGVSFLYGIFHAAGPGHGKAVISSYLVANEETWRRGIVLSFASAMLQALVAIVVVGVAAAALQATAKTMNSAIYVIEVLSYALIALIGARLTWTKGRGFVQALRATPPPIGSEQHQAHHRHNHAVPATVLPTHHHDHHHHDHPVPAPAAHAHDDASCDHLHGPEPAELAGPGGWKRGLTAIIAVGLRPCSGAILVLVFALAQGLFWAGVASTFVMGLGTAITVAAIATLAVVAKDLAKHVAMHKSGAGALLVRGIEVAAALVVLVFGLALLAGYMVTERIAGF
jgi:nickel/cobalt transporter (NicO) family protein